MTAMAGGALRLIDSPVCYMRERTDGPPQWTSALLPLAVYVAASAVSTIVVGERLNLVTRAALREAGQTMPEVPLMLSMLIGGGSVVAGATFVFALQVGALWAVDALAVQSGRTPRLVEAAAVSYWPQAVYALAAAAAMVLFFEPEPLRVPTGVSGIQLQSLIGDYGARMQATALPSSLMLVRQMFLVWLTALHACALRAVSGLSVGGAWTAGVVLVALFVVGPALVQWAF